MVDWQRRRSVFNHDWLRRLYLPTLEKWLNILDGAVEDPVFEEDFVSTRLPDWEDHRDEARALVEGFARAMSPRNHIERGVLRDCQTATHGWLGDLIHGLWSVRAGTEDLVSEGRSALEAINAKYDELQVLIARDFDAVSPEALRPLRAKFQELSALCGELARVMSSFPTRIEVV